VKELGIMVSATLFITAIVSAMALFIDLVFLYKRIKDEKDIAFNTIGGAVLVGINVYSVLGVMMR